MHREANLVGGTGTTWRLEQLKSFYSDIQDGLHGSNLENLQTKSAPKQ